MAVACCERENACDACLGVGVGAAGAAGAAGADAGDASMGAMIVVCNTATATVLLK